MQDQASMESLWYPYGIAMEPYRSLSIPIDPYCPLCFDVSKGAIFYPPMQPLRSFNWTTVQYTQLCDLAIQAFGSFRISQDVSEAPHIVTSLMTFLIFFVLCGFIFYWAFTVLQALTSLLVLLCISTLRDEDRVTWEALITKPLALQSMTFGRHRNGAAAWPFLSDPKHPCVAGCTLLCHIGSCQCQEIL